VLTILRPKLRFQAAIEGIAIGATLGLIDVHSTDGDWFDAKFAYLLAGFVLGLRHAGRAWQAWIPLGLCFYLIHRVAIAYGYRPPYVEADADSALVSFLVLWPAGLGLALGVFVRFAIACQLWVTQSRQGKANQDQPEMANREIPQHADRGRASSRHLAATSTEGIRRQRLTVRRLMVIISLLAIHLAFVRILLNGEV